MDSKPNKILFIIPSLPDYVPYVYNYLNIADSLGTGYDVVCWNRRDSKMPSMPFNFHVYEKVTCDAFSPLRKLYDLLGFYIFAKKHIRSNDYNTVFVYTISCAFVFFNYLIKKKNHFVFDIRDYSPLINNFFSRFFVRSLLHYSTANIISSDGFRSWLPNNEKYILCHNIGLQSKYEEDANDNIPNGLRILTIGALRDATANISLINAFANTGEVLLHFAGDGNATPILKDYVLSNHVHNVIFSGRYKKTEEDSIVKHCDLINILLPHNMISDYLMSNRFYLSLKHRKPMIVNAGCFQAEEVAKYGIGVIVNPEDDIKEIVLNYWNSLDRKKYSENCSKYLCKVEKDMAFFKGKIEEIIKGDGICI